MNVIERPLPGGGDKANSPGLIVVHAMGEYIRDPDPIFAANFLEKLGLSAHALIVPNGDVMICRQDSQRAYHARGFNTDSLGVEFLVPGSHNYGSFLKTLKSDWVTPAQYDSGIDFVGQWMSDHNISNNKVKRHSDISPGRKVDPGRGFKWEWFLGELS